MSVERSAGRHKWTAEVAVRGCGAAAGPLSVSIAPKEVARGVAVAGRRDIRLAGSAWLVGGTLRLNRETVAVCVRRVGESRVMEARSDEGAP